MVNGWLVGGLQEVEVCSCTAHVGGRIMRYVRDSDYGERMAQLGGR